MGRDIHLSVTSHDHHNLELKVTLGSERKSIDAKVEAFLFLPPTVKLRSFGKSEILDDFHSRVRLSLPLDGDHEPTLELLLRRVERELSEEISDEAFSEAIQRVGAGVGEALKQLKTAHGRELHLSHFLSSTPEQTCETLRGLADGIERAAKQISLLRVALVYRRHRPHATLLLEYVTHLHLEYLGGLHDSLDQIKKNSARFPLSDYEAGWEAISSTIERLAGSFAPGTTAIDEREQELQLVRISQLKKFFQANMFVELSRRQAMKKVAEPAAAAAAGFAALWAVFFQHFQQPHLMRFGLSGVTVICVGVAAYILKDRIKDRVKAMITKKVSQYFPDIEEDLIARQKLLGRTKEWIAIRRPAQLPLEVLELRNVGKISEADGFASEDVLSRIKHTKLEPLDGDFERGEWAIQESLRLNLERYLKYLDNPYKRVTFVNGEGKLARLRAHRVYYFHLILRAEVITQDENSAVGRKKLVKSYRVVVDKAGVQRVDYLGPFSAHDEAALGSSSAWPVGAE